VQGDFTREEARVKVLQIIDGDDALSSLNPLIAEVDGPNDVIQVDGIKCVGVRIGSPDFVQQFAATKASEIIRDVEKVQVVSDSLIHFHLLRFCQNTHLAYKNRSMPPEVMAAGPCNLQHVNSAIVKAILGRGTKLMHDIGSSSDKWSSRALDWYSSIMQKACHRGRFWNNSKRGIEHRRILLRDSAIRLMGASTPQPSALGWLTGSYPT